MSIKLTDTQLVMLSAAAQREDRCLVASQKLKGGVALKVANKLISAGLVEEIEAEARTPMWRRDTETGQAYALKLTAAGAKAIAIEGAQPGNAHTETGAHRELDQAVISSEVEASDAAQLKESASVASSAPRGGSKLAGVLGLLQQGHGATIDELIAATGWLAHTTRAALTGLRKRGYAVTIDRSDNERGSFYRIKAEVEGGPVARPIEEPADSPTSRKPVERLSKPRARRAA